MLCKRILSGVALLAGMGLLGVEFISHRGESADAPENTQAAFDLAWQRNADGIELDIYLTADGEVVACHDGNAKRTSGKDLDIAQSNYKDLLLLDFGALKNKKFTGEHIPLLRDVLARVPEGKKVFIEIKPENSELVKALKQVLDKSGLKPEQISIISFNGNMVRQSKELMPEIKVYFLAGWELDKETGEYRPGIESLIQTARDVKADGLDLAGYTKWPAEAVKAWKDAGLELAVWTIDDPELARYYAEECGVVAVTSNCAAKIKETLAN